MATISGLNIYPIKSCGGIALREAVLLDSGLAYDRNWMLVDSRHRFITQRECPRMALIRTQLDLEDLIVTAPSMPALHIPLFETGAMVEVTIWDDRVTAFDMGPTIDRWFSDVLSAPVRLVRFDPECRRLSNPQWTAGVEATNQFSDGYPILLIAQASLDDLNRRIVSRGGSPVPMNRFRPNIVIEGVEAYEEDFVDTLQGAGYTLQAVKPCPRCPIPTIDQETAQCGREPTETLMTYRANARLDGAITFGQNVIVLNGEGCALRIGDALETTLRFDN